MADLKFEVDSSEVSRAVDELIRMGKASKDTAKAFEQGFRKVVSWQERFQAEQGRINATLEKNYRAQTLSNKSAKESAAVFQQLDAEVSKAATSYSQLKAAIDPVYAAQMRMKKGHDAIRAALKAGLITRAEAAQSLRAYRKEVQLLSQSQMAATKASNRFGVVTQQAGYQIGDFLVQVQSGTNPFVAFGQQATQLVGILPLMTGAFGLSTTALIGLSAGLGIAIPLVTAIGAAIFKMSKSSDKASDSLMTLESVQKSVADSIEKTNLALIQQEKGLKSVEQAFLSKKISDAREELEKYTKATRDQVAALLAQAKAEEAAIIASGGAGKTPEQLDEIARQTQEAVTKSRKEGLDALQDTYNELVAILGIEEGRERSLNRSNAYLEDMAEFFRKAQEDLDKQAKSQQESESRLNRISLIMSQIRAETEDAAKAAKDFTDNLVLGKGFLDASVRSGVASGAIPPSALGDLDQTDAEKAMERVLANRRRAARKGSGSVSSKDSLVSDPLADLNKRIALDTKLLGVSEERAEVLRAIANSDKEYSQAAIEGAISRLEVYNKEAELLEEAAAKQQQIADTMKTSMEDAFMSIVDGTKSAEDAFKDMARMIISELYKVLVVQQLVGSFQTGGGGILGSLAPIFGRASGGTVMSNQPYLVGEKGPEIIMPQNRGHVMNADLTAKAMSGGGESVNIVQNFNFSANGDDSVKKLIAQAAPQIANMTQKQIMDSRRRGGAMKSTFG
jgi:flagellar basal body-associated protein FliL